MLGGAGSPRGLAGDISLKLGGSQRTQVARSLEMETQRPSSQGGRVIRPTVQRGWLQGQAERGLRETQPEADSGLLSPNRQQAQKTRRGWARPSTAAGGLDAGGPRSQDQQSAVGVLI